MKKLIFLFLIMIVFSLVSAEDIIEEFKAQNEEDWNITVAPWGYITHIAKEKPEMIGQPLTENEAIEYGKNFLEINSRFFGIESVGFSGIERSGSGETPYLLWIIDFEGQFYEGIPVEATYTRVLMTIDGQIYGVGNRRYALEDVPTVPSIPEEQAINISKEYINTTENPVDTELNIVIEENETDINYGLIWKVCFGEPYNEHVIMDAMNGDVLSTDECVVDIEEKSNIGLILLAILALIVTVILVKKWLKV